jgi:hypothetical protein
VLPVVTNVSALLPWTPSSCTSAEPPLIHGQYSFHQGQRKQYVSVLVVMWLPLPPPHPDFEDSQGKWNTNLLDMTEDTHHFERITLVKLKLPWPHLLGMCVNLPLCILPISPSRVVVIFLSTEGVLRYLIWGIQLMNISHHGLCLLKLGATWVSVPDPHTALRCIAWMRFLQG